MPNITTFDNNRHHIHIAVLTQSIEKQWYVLRGILDTGAPASEFSGQALEQLGLLSSDQVSKQLSIQTGLQSQKYDKIILPQIKICGHKLHKMKVFVSHFEKSWAIDALIGLDFFRRFRTLIDYQKGHLETEPFVGLN